MLSSGWAWGHPSPHSSHGHLVQLGQDAAPWSRKQPRPSSGVERAWHGAKSGWKKGRKGGGGMQAFDGPGKALGTHRAAGSLGRTEQSLYTWRTLVPLATRLSLPHQPPAHPSSPHACGLPGHLPSVSPSTALTPLHQLSWAAVSTLPQPPKKKAEARPLLRTPGQTPPAKDPHCPRGQQALWGKDPCSPHSSRAAAP